MFKKLFVLAGGFGTRLRPLVSEVPKPLAPVLQHSFLEYLLLNWKRQGIKEIVILLYHEAEKIKSMISDLRQTGVLDGLLIQTITENQPLGTGGALLNAIDELRIKDSFLVVNADTWLSNGLNLLITSGPNSMGAIKVANVARYGEINIKKGYVKAFNEKSGHIKPGWINAGIYHLRPEIFNNHQLKEVFDLEKTILPTLVQKSQLKAIKLDTDFIDIGVPEDYLRFCNWVEEGRVNEI
jgi:NDP-sugar pyrophosphorylase family protein